MDIRSFLSGRRGGSPDHPPSKKRAEPSRGAAKQPPLTIVTWNANGLVSSVKHREEIHAFMELHDPDIVCIQEARLKVLAVG